MKLGYLLLIAFIGYIAFKYYSVNVSIQQNNQCRLVARPGVGVYCGAAAANTCWQLLAFRPNNPYQSTQPGYAPPLGPNENYPYVLRSCGGGSILAP